MQDEWVLPCVGGSDTRRKWLEWRLATVEARIRSLTTPPNPALSALESVERLEEDLVRLFQELERCEVAAQPKKVAREIERLSEQDFLDYLNCFHDHQMLGLAGRQVECVVAQFISLHLFTGDCRLQVFLDYATVSDGFDEARATLPAWAERVSRLTTPPVHPAPFGTPITAAEVRAVLMVD